MTYPRRLLALALPMIAACATAGESGVEVGVDGSVEHHPDARPSPIDAPIQSIDAPTSCTPAVVELLTNPAFDAAPDGTGWVATPISAAYPLITAQGSVAPQSPTNKAWMGRLAVANAKDSIYQDVVIPASTTQLVLTGFYDVRTLELGATVYDRGAIELVQTDGTTMIEPVIALDNAHTTTTWTAIDHPFTASLAGQTVRLRLRTDSDNTLASSFYFDSLSLKATTCP